MKPKIVERNAMKVVGVRERHRAGKIEALPRQWEAFNARENEIVDSVADVCYGIIEDDARPGDRGFFYTAGKETTSFDRVPAGLSGVEVPGGTFAVFTHHGPISEFPQTVMRIWREWLPASGLKPTGAPDVEIYDARFKMNAPDSECDYCVPVAPRKR